MILLTGGSGFIGKRIHADLLLKGMMVRTLSRSKSDIRVNLSTQIPLIQDRFEVIIHAAGLAHQIGASDKSSMSCSDVNFEGTKNLVEGITRFGVLPKALLLISSVSVYGQESGLEIEEESPLLGTTQYAQSKIQAERFLINWGGENGVQIGVVRLPLVVGKNAPGNLGHLVHLIESGRYFSIKENNAKRSMIWIGDLHKILTALIEKGGVYNLTDGYHPTISEFESELTKRLGRKLRRVPISIAKIGARIGDFIGYRFPLNSERLAKLTSTLTFSDAKARKELGWKPTPVMSKLHEIIK